jgi:hypothetical protein
VKWEKEGQGRRVYGATCGIYDIYLNREQNLKLGGRGGKGGGSYIGRMERREKGIIVENSQIISFKEGPITNSPTD